MDQPGYAVLPAQMQDVFGALHIHRPESRGELAGDVDDAGGVDDQGVRSAPQQEGDSRESGSRTSLGDNR